MTWILIAQYSTWEYIIGKIKQHYVKLSMMTSHGSLCMCVCESISAVFAWNLSLYICVTVQLPTELLNYQSLLFLCECEHGYCVGINVYVFVDVIMFLCMHTFSLQPSCELLCACMIYACTEHACIPFLISSYLFELLYLAASAITISPSGLRRRDNMGGQYRANLNYTDRWWWTE